MRRLRVHRAQFDPALPTLRRRTAHLLAGLPPRSRALVRLVPLLLSGRFRRPALDTEPPGVEQSPRRRRWGRLCAQLDLPPPIAFCQHRPLIRAALLAPGASGGLELLIVPREGLAPRELGRVMSRVDGIAQLAQRHAPTLEVRMAGPAELDPALFAWAAVVAGDVPALADAPTLDWRGTFARAPTPLLRCLMLLVPPHAPSPLSLLRARAAPIAPAAFVARWSGHPVAVDVAALSEQELSPSELEGLSRRFRGACVEALRKIPLHERAAVRAVVRPALFGARVPPVLRAHLERTLRGHVTREVQVGQGWQLELDGLVLARAPTLDQLRALALAESKLLARPEPVWRRLAGAVALGVRRAVVAIEPGFLRHLVVSVPPSGRPRARRVDAPGLLQFVLTTHRAGVPVELLTAPGSDPNLVARANQLLATALRPDEPAGIQLGDKLLLLEPHRTRLLPLASALRRPRAMAFLPERAELLPALRRPLGVGLPTVQVAAFPDGDSRAAVFALDAAGTISREVVPLDLLEASLREMREVLRRATEPYLMAAAVHPLLTSLAGRRPDSPPTLTLIAELTAHGDRVSFDGEAFGAGTPLGWSALAEAVLSHWSPGTWAHVGVEQVVAPAGTPALALLAARSRVLRRLDTHLRRIMQHLRAA